MPPSEDNEDIHTDKGYFQELSLGQGGVAVVPGGSLDTYGD